MVSLRRATRLLLVVLLPLSGVSGLAGFAAPEPAPLAGCSWDDDCKGGSCNPAYWVICRGTPDRICQANGEGDDEDSAATL